MVCEFPGRSEIFSLNVTNVVRYDATSFNQGYARQPNVPYKFIRRKSEFLGTQQILLLLLLRLNWWKDASWIKQKSAIIISKYLEIWNLLWLIFVLFCLYLYPNSCNHTPVYRKKNFIKLFNFEFTMGLSTISRSNLQFVRNICFFIFSFRYWVHHRRIYLTKTIQDDMIPIYGPDEHQYLSNVCRNINFF